MTGNSRHVTYRDLLRKVSPTWLQTGEAERILYGVGVVVDALGDAVVAAVKMRFPGYSADSLPIIGRERRIRRGRYETNATYEGRLLRWLDDHKLRGGPYAMLRQLFAYYAPLTFPIELRYASGRRYTLGVDGSITRSDAAWSPPGGAAKWARWWLYFTWPEPLPPTRTWGDSRRWGDGGVWGSGLNATQIRDLRMVPRDWNAAHAVGRIVLTAPNGTVSISAEG